MFRVGSECVQSMFRVYQSMFSLVVKIVVIAVSSASSVSVFGIFSFAIESYIYETDFTLGLSQKYHF